MNRALAAKLLVLTAIACVVIAEAISPNITNIKQIRS